MQAAMQSHSATTIMYSVRLAVTGLRSTLSESLPAPIDLTSFLIIESHYRHSEDATRISDSLPERIVKRLVTC